jgi:tRNA A-37 threonylcarbamoyl transferase component Bud32
VEINLPAEVQIGKLLGEGQRCVVYAATYRGEPVAVKAYRASMMEKCRRRYGVTRSAFEYRRNTEAYRIDAIRRFIARPIAVFGEGDGYSHAFVQQRVEGIRLRALVDQLGSVPPETLASLRTVVREAHRVGLYDLDLCANNIRVQKTLEGWQPILFDFNMLPAYLFARSPMTKFFYKFGLRKPWGRDLRHLKDFEDWPDRFRRYRIPLLGLKIRTQLLNRYEFWVRRAMDARRTKPSFDDPESEISGFPANKGTNWNVPASELSHA